MVKSSPLPKGTVVLRPRRHALAGASFMFILLMVLIGALLFAGMGLFAPTRLAMGQERVLSLLHGGIAQVDEATFVDGCVRVDGSNAPQAITRTRRTVIFRDGTSLEVVFSNPPTPTNVGCP